MASDTTSNSTIHRLADLSSSASALIKNNPLNNAPMVYLTGLDLTTQTQKLSELKVGAIQETPAVDQPQEDPLIAKGEENIVYFGVLLLAVGIVTVIGILSRRLDYALGFAFLLSVVIIAILVIM